MQQRVTPAHRESIPKQLPSHVLKVDHARSCRRHDASLQIQRTLLDYGRGIVLRLQRRTSCRPSTRSGRDRYAPFFRNASRFASWHAITTVSNRFINASRRDLGLYGISHPNTKQHPNASHTMSRGCGGEAACNRLRTSSPVPDAGPFLAPVPAFHWASERYRNARFHAYGRPTDSRNNAPIFFRVSRAGGYCTFSNFIPGVG
jgi:hypothetical protein